MRLRLVPLNPTIGDLAGNAKAMRAHMDGALRDGVDLLVFPELSVSGYPPKDLLLHEGFVEACMDASQSLAAHAGKTTVLVGSPWLADPGRPRAGVHNSLVALREGKVLARHDKRLLPTYDVFDEDRYFTPGSSAVCVEVAGVRVGLAACEDLWRGEDAGALSRYAGRADPVEELVKAGATLIVNASASPFVLGKGPVQRKILTDHVRRHGVALAAVNQLGGDDDLIFDGRAEMHVPDNASPTGARLLGVGGAFSEQAVTLDLPAERAAWPGLRAVADPLDGASDERLLWGALVLGTRDYCRKTGFSRCVIGLSGGIDSAVTACIASAALGTKNVLGVSMPSKYSSAGSRDDAAALANSLGSRLVFAPIAPAHETLGAMLGAEFAALAEQAGAANPGTDVTDENLQSRIRGLILMAFSNKTGGVVLTTGNKSELGVGYCTLYGDMNGGLAVLADVTKAHVYRLARFINANARELGFTSAPPTGPIPLATIEKPPSAELRPDQTDQDTLPPYDEVDAILDRYVKRRQSPARVAQETGIDAKTVARIVRMVDTSEFKRKQAAIGLKVTSVAFGSGRRWPIAQGWRPGVGGGA